MNIVLIVILTTTSFALYASQFNSYLLIIPLLALYLIIRKNSFLSKAPVTFNEYAMPIWKQSIQAISYFSFSVLILNLQLIFENGAYSGLHPDFSFYAGISEILSTTGIENRLMDIALAGKRSYTFYHYFELWFNGLVSETLGITHLRGLMFITIPLFATILLLGIYELQMKLFPDRWFTKGLIGFMMPLSIFFLFPFTITLRWLISFGNDFTPWNPSIALDMRLKWIIVLSGFVYLLQSYLKHKERDIILIMGFISVIYPTTMVAILPGLVIWYFIQRKKLPAIAKWDLLAVLAVIGGVMWRVNSFGDGVILTSDEAIPSTISLIKQFYFSDTSRLFYLIKEPVLRTFYLLLAFLPLLVFLIPKWKEVFFQVTRTYWPLMLLFCILYVLSAGGIVLLEFSYDGDQLHRNIFYPLYVLLTFVGILYLLQCQGMLKKAGLVLLSTIVGLNAWGIGQAVVNKRQQAGNVEVTSIDTIIETMVKSPGKSAFIADESYFKNTRNKNFYFIIPGHNLKMYIPNYFPMCLSIDRVNLEDEGDWFNLGSTLLSGAFFNRINIAGAAYEKAFKDDAALKYLIVDENILELNPIEELFDVKYLGKVDRFTYYKKISNS